MSDKYIEKSFLYFVVLSLLVHIVIGTVFYFMPEKKRETRQESYVVDLMENPVPRAVPSHKDSIKKAPKSSNKSRVVSIPKRDDLMPGPETIRRKTHESPTIEKIYPSQPLANGAITKPGLKLNNLPGLDKLMPSGRSLVSLENRYRDKYQNKLGGDTIFLDDENNLMGSFSRRYLEALNQRWVQVGYPLVSKGQLGYGLILITIARDGSVTEAQVIESSGNRVIDDAAVLTAKTAGYVGPLPKKWPYEIVKGYYIYTAGYEMR